MANLIYTQPSFLRHQLKLEKSDFIFYTSVLEHFQRQSKGKKEISGLHDDDNVFRVFAILKFWVSKLVATVIIQ